MRWLPAEQADLFFVTLVKSEQHYSPTTMYADRAITERLFQWESQSTTSAASATGQRYVHHAARGSTVHLFVRETRVPDRDLGAPRLPVRRPDDLPAAQRRPAHADRVGAGDPATRRPVRGGPHHRRLRGDDRPSGGVEEPWIACLARVTTVGTGRPRP